MSSSFLSRLLSVGVLALVSSSQAFPDIYMTAYYEAPGVESIGAAGKAQLCRLSPGGCIIGRESFNQLPTGWIAPGYVSSFSHNGQITGTFTGNGAILPADQYGGAGGTGKYLLVSAGHTETLTLNEGINFFGLWFSALDATNTLSFYQTGNSAPVYTFGASQFQGLVGSCPESTGYCGNPNAKFLDQNISQQYAFLDFFSTGGSFNSVVISEGNSGGFEADNETVGFLENPTALGTAFSPEPGDTSLVAIGAALLLGCAALRGFTPRIRLCHEAMNLSID